MQFWIVDDIPNSQPTKNNSLIVRLNYVVVVVAVISIFIGDHDIRSQPIRSAIDFDGLAAFVNVQIAVYVFQLTDDPVLEIAELVSRCRICLVLEQELVKRKQTSV